MAQVKVNLPPRSLADVYSRIVRRELGLPVFWPRFSKESGQAFGLFARSLAVAIGQAFAAGEAIRAEFALALRDRLRQYERKSPIEVFVSLGEVLDHSAALSEIVAGRLPETWDGAIAISDDYVANAARADVRRLSVPGATNRSSQKSLWPEGSYPPWWRRFPEAPDSWVAPMAQLGEPLWSSTSLSGEKLAYLLTFGLDRIDTKPELIQPWIQSVPSLVAAASRPRADIGEVVKCCLVDP